MTIVLLTLLVLVHAGLAGFRSGAGRNPRLFLGRYYGRCVVRGLLLGLVQILFFGTIAWMAPAPLYADFMAAADRMLFVLLRFAGVGVMALSLYALNWTETTILATTLLLGPMNLVRPVVVTFAGLYAAWGAQPITAVLALAATSLTLAQERLLEWGKTPWWDRL